MNALRKGLYVRVNTLRLDQETFAVLCQLIKATGFPIFRHESG